MGRLGRAGGQQSAGWQGFFWGVVTHTHTGYHLLLILCWVRVQGPALGGALGREINQAPADN